ncbi:MAG: DUF2236 domain-containing protein [Deltaproteobacteria bacterium]|nr:DUF2236 domain-containing protein [Deltaproteobacteria bacterium]
MRNSNVEPGTVTLTKGASKRLFPRDGMSWRVNREMVLLLGGGRALLMQVAHPKVAAAVAKHSDFTNDPLGRLHRTMNTMWSIVFDEMAEAQASLDRIKNLHGKVRGVVEQNEPSFAGSRYDALDPELLLWVHATLVDSSMAAYDCFVKPLSPVEASRYYEESKLLARFFEIPESLVPVSLAEFHAYMNAMLAGSQIRVGPAARSLAKEILYPPTRLLQPAGPLFRLMTSGLLPPVLREAYAMTWSERRSKAFELAVRIVRILLPLVPSPLRVVPQARAAERRAQENGTLE